MQADGQLLCAYIGLGACGSAIAEAANVRGFGKAVILNSSSEDLKAATMIQAQSKLKLQSINGAAKSRKIAFDAFKSEYPHFINVVKTTLQEGNSIEDYDIIFIIASGGGGTGSGIIPIASRIFRKVFPASYIVPVVVFPSNYERGIVQDNALNCLKEFGPNEEEAKDETWSPFSIVLVDNNRNDTELIEAKYDTINNEIVSNIHRLVNCTKTSRISNIDSADRKSMFSDPGLLVIGSATINPEDASPIRDAVKRAIDATPATADITKSVKRVALQIEAPANLYTKTNITDAQNMFKNVAGIFEGYYPPDEPKDGETPDNRVLIALSGASLPETEIHERESVVENTFKAQPEAEIKIGKGNSGLKSAWGSTTKPKVAESIEKPAENFDNLFAGFGN